ncbi:SDR family NAD(P)-dependent oxidoreductase [Vibrio cholerae]|uniref:SDR family NAD(P)-dependent oxidoreductase n=1 Tax=Vibrio cholerae TaxID=666 RepID=UPI000BA96F88|nr:SDR family NAD(P)-dependent oxidoreductase [Vibrio cholerae]PAS27427.1 hypothetical protein CGT71_18075 [Vibrio cholerae]
MNIAIFGASKGLGLAIAKLFAKKGYTVFDLSRTIYSISNIKNVSCDVRSLDSIENSFKSIDVIFDIIVYCPSLWGESGNLSATELERFLQTGPLGFNKVCETLLKTKKISDNAIIINISSTAVSSVGKSNNPCYSISKRLQDDITTIYQSLVKQSQIRFTTINLGTLGEEKHIPVSDITSYIEWLNSLSINSFPTNITISSRDEV